MRAHYHLYNGIGGGYSGELQGTYSTRKDAEEALANSKRELQEFAANSIYKPLIVQGTVRNGYVEMVPADGESAFTRTSFIERCEEKGCEEVGNE